MTKRLLFLIIFLIHPLFASTSCELLINEPAYLKNNYGSINFTAFNSNEIWINASSGNISSYFNFDDLYEVTDSVGSRYFRLDGIAYNPSGTNQTYIYDIAYGFGVIPPAGNYILKSYSTTRKPIFGRYLATIGDSITHWEYGRFMRCLMRDAGVMYDFSGEFTDVFGFGNEGAGGNNTQDVLNRMSSIVIADTYFVLIGTNDYALLTPSQTVANIQQIAQQLKIKNPCAKVYISTLLPRNDINNSNVQAINQLLLASASFCPNCFVIDVGGQFNALPNWKSLLMDTIHPNYNGYVALSSIINSLIN